MNNIVKYPNMGIGLGLRVPHYEHILSKKPVVDWFEIISENYFGEGGKSQQVLAEILQNYQVVQHGVGLYLGNSEGLNDDYLKKLKNLASITNTPWFSDHLCWGSVDGNYSHDLLPMPYTQEAITTCINNIKKARDFVEVPMAVENVSSYVEFHQSKMTEWQFLTEVVEGADCGILLDVNNIYVSSVNHNFDPFEYLENIPHHRVMQMHIAGHSQYERFIVDTHDSAVIDPVWKLYERAVQLCGPTPTLLEWDEHIPGFNEVHNEAMKAERYYSNQLSAIS